VVDLRTEQPSLEDVFLAYYAGGEAAGDADGGTRPEVGVRRAG